MHTIVTNDHDRPGRHLTGQRRVPWGFNGLLGLSWPSTNCRGVSVRVELRLPFRHQFLDIYMKSERNCCLSSAKCVVQPFQQFFFLERKKLVHKRQFQVNSYWNSTAIRRWWTLLPDRLIDFSSRSIHFKDLFTFFSKSPFKRWLNKAGD